MKLLRTRSSFQYFCCYLDELLLYITLADNQQNNSAYISFQSISITNIFLLLAILIFASTLVFYERKGG